MQDYIVPKGIIDLSVVNENLLEVMLSVKGNPTMIPQANSMCLIASRICDMAKVQVQQAQMIVELNNIKNDHY